MTMIMFPWQQIRTVPLPNSFYVGYLFISTVVKLQTGLSQDQGPHKWALILAPTCLLPAQHIFQKIQLKLCIIYSDADDIFRRPFCIPAFIGLMPAGHSLDKL